MDRASFRHETRHETRCGADLTRTVSTFCRRFSRDESGVSAVFFGIMFTFLFLVTAMAVDYGRATKEVMDQQYALDAAVLAASSDLGSPDQDTLGQARAEKFFAANMPPGSTAVVNVDLDDVAGEVTGTSSNALGTIMYNSAVLKEHRRYQMNVGAASRVVKGDGTVEIALVVDNSGSMAAPYIDDLKTASTNLINVVFAGADGSDRVKVGVVPFATSVNVGSAYASASWMDTEALSSTHSENFSQTASRFDLFNDLNITWGGCVEARPSPHDVTDTIPTSGTPDTLFTPMFAPDEPDDSNASAAGYSNYPNNYISDYEGTCPTPDQVCVVYNKKKQKCTQYAPAPMGVAEAQSRVCKYSGATIIDGTGPNYGCSTHAVLPLTQNKSSVQTAIDALAAGGNTNIGEGAMWGWRVLSPAEPFTDGRSYSDTKNKKIMIIMTDGANTYSAQSNHNKSRYGAFGYGVKDRLGTTYTSSAFSTAMAGKLTTACANAKASNVTVYTVAFRLEGDATTTALLQGCATDNDHAFVAASGNALVQAFENIAKDISRLRIAG